ncbi:energy transducer TonB [Labilibacter marinus]|uniref:energy transducer TonB n=1 Tax=Labilibacter marinus TaxID=1477105 RepID=UPI00082E29FE|nr:energy transducer TonB [Labilibacter marinus]
MNKVKISILLIIFTNSVYGQIYLEYNQETIDRPTHVLVIDGEEYPIDSTFMYKIDPNWIKKIEILKREEEKVIFGDKDGIVLIYPKKKYYERTLQYAESKHDSIVYKKVDSIPEFHYKDSKVMTESLKLFFRHNYKMPPILQDNAYFGKIYFSSIVEKNGELSNIEIARGIDKTIDESVKDFIKKEMPKWIPAKIKTKNVRFYLMFPVDIEWMYGETD